MIGILSRVSSSWEKRPTYELCDGDIGTFHVVFSLLSLFTSISNLEAKLRTMEMHTEDQPHSCVQRDLSFKMTKDLKTHLLLS